MKSKTVSLTGESRAAVILGDGLPSRVLAMKLRLLYGVMSVICDRKRSVFSILLPICDFGRTYHGNDSGVLLCQLEDMAGDECDTLRFLLAATDEYSSLLNLHKGELEDRYIITDKKGIVSFLKSK